MYLSVEVSCAVNMMRLNLYLILMLHYNWTVFGVETPPVNRNVTELMLLGA